MIRLKPVMRFLLSVCPGTIGTSMPLTEVYGHTVPQQLVFFTRRTQRQTSSPCRMAIVDLRTKLIQAGCLHLLLRLDTSRGSMLYRNGRMNNQPKTYRQR